MRYLIVDDDLACRELLKRVLADYGECDTAADGNEAVEAIQNAWNNDCPYDLVCLDIMMPNCDGHEALGFVRKFEQEQGIPDDDQVKIIMTTAMSDRGNLMGAVFEGCQSYVTKPIDVESFLMEIRDLGALPSTSEKTEEPRKTTQQPRKATDQRPRFLIVDDDLACRELLKGYLSSHADCDLVVDGQEAVDAVQFSLEDKTPYDLICLDVMMPRIDGHEALRGIRKLENEHGVFGSSGTKVIMTTALKDSKHCVQSFREGCESYLTKPIDEEQLLEKIRILGVQISQPV